MHNNRFKTLFLILSFLAIVFAFVAKTEATSNSINITLQVMGSPEKKIQKEDKMINFNINNKLLLAII